jgi:hypothetical protein
MAFHKFNLIEALTNTNRPMECFFNLNDREDCLAFSFIDLTNILSLTLMMMVLEVFNLLPSSHLVEESTK